MSCCNRTSGLAIQYVPNKFLTDKLCELAVKQNASSFEYLYGKRQSVSLCYLACQKNGYNLHLVPEELRSIRLCRIAVEQNCFALSHVPQTLLTYELCKIAVLKHNSCIKHVPKHLKGYYSLCEQVIKTDPNAIYYLKDSFFKGSLFFDKLIKLSQIQLANKINEPCIIQAEWNLKDTDNDFEQILFNENNYINLDSKTDYLADTKIKDKASIKNKTRLSTWISRFSLKGFKLTFD